jgi:glycosyltransferase involved in cell wall biosynthesis
MAREAHKRRHLLHVFSTFGVGGPQIRFISLANALGTAYRHSILAMDGNIVALQGLSVDVPYSVETMPVRKGTTVSLANVWNARRLLRRLDPDLLLTYNWGSIEWSLANWRRPLRHIHFEDGFGPDESSTQQKRARVLMRRYLLSRGTRIVVPSATLHDLATRVWRLPQRNVMHIVNGIECERFARRPDPATLVQFGLDAAGLVVGTLAGLRREKNIARLIRVFASLPADTGARLVIVGDGPEHAALAALVAERVIFTGALAEPERILGRFDVFALSSDTEQMPNVVLEAMAAGLPIVATDVGDVRRIVAEQNAPYVLPQEDEAGLARVLAELLRDPARRAALGDANRRHVREHYTLARMVARYDALFAAT